MRSPFDQFIKRLVRKGFSPGGHLETEAEVSPDSLRIDIWFWPDAKRAAEVLEPLGLLGYMGWTSCTLEPYHRTPSGVQVVDSLVRHRLFCRDLARRRPRPPAPVQWLITAGRPDAALAGLGFRPSSLGPGIYESPTLLRTMIVVVSELPRTRYTLLVRLMGAGKTLERAIREAKALPFDAPERRLALPILLRLRLEVAAEPTKRRNKSEQEFLMTTREFEKYLRDLEKKGRQEGEVKGRQEGEVKGFAKAVLAFYRSRFGAPPVALVAAVEDGEGAELERLLGIVASGSADEVAAALRKPRAKAPARSTPKRRSSAPRRAPAAG